MSSLLASLFSSQSLPYVIAAPAFEQKAQELTSFLKKLGSPYAHSVALATSGSSGKGLKFALFAPDAFEASAQAVNEWCGADEGGDWCCALPTYHAGGLMVYLRAALAGTKVYQVPGKWEPYSFVSFLTKHPIAWLSLVPTQVFDLVTLGLKAPSSLRCIFVGGGALSLELGQKARALGWPVVQSYGMSETASQIATALPSAPYHTENLPLLPHWEVQVEPLTERLQLRGPARFIGYAHALTTGGFSLESFPAEEWWTSQDRVLLTGRHLSFLSRSDRFIKMLGELVDLDALEAQLLSLSTHPSSIALCSVDHPRKGQSLILCSDHPEELERLLSLWKSTQKSLYHPEPFLCTALPRNELGKLQRALLEQQVKAAFS